MIPTAQPINTYEVYPGCSPYSFGQWFLEYKRITLEAFCMNEGVDFESLPQLVSEVLVEWELKEECHRDRKEAVRHMVHHLRIKKNAQRNNQRQSGQSSGTDAGRVAEDLEVAQAILRRINPGKGY